MMQVKVSTQEFQKAIKTVQPLITTKIAGAGDVVLRAGGDKLTLEASNRSLFFSLDIPAEVIESGEVLIDGFKLIAITNRAKEPFIGLKAKKRLVVTAGKSRAQLAVRDLMYSDFPSFDIDLEHGITFSMRGKDLIQAASRVVFAAASDEVDFMPLMAVNLAFDRGVAVATDKGTRAALTSLPGVDGGGQVLIEADHLNNLVKALPEDNIQVTVLPNLLVVRCFQGLFAASRLADTFPASVFDLFENPDINVRLTVAKKELAELMVMANMFARSVDSSDTVTLSITKDEVRGLMSTPEDEIQTVLNTAHCDCPNFEISFSAASVRSILQKCTQDKIELSFISSKAPIYFFDTEATYIQVPTVKTK